MKETYWERFLMTGKPEDYLQYKMESDKNIRREAGGWDAENREAASRPKKEKM